MLDHFAHGINSDHVWCDRAERGREVIRILEKVSYLMLSGEEMQGGPERIQFNSMNWSSSSAAVVAAVVQQLWQPPVWEHFRGHDPSNDPKHKHWQHNQHFTQKIKQIPALLGWMAVRITSTEENTKYTWVLSPQTQAVTSQCGLWLLEEMTL